MERVELDFEDYVKRVLVPPPEKQLFSHYMNLQSDAESSGSEIAEPITFVRDKSMLRDTVHKSR